MTSGAELMLALACMHAAHRLEHLLQLLVLVLEHRLQPGRLSEAAKHVLIHQVLEGPKAAVMPWMQAQADGVQSKVSSTATCSSAARCGPENIGKTHAKRLSTSLACLRSAPSVTESAMAHVYALPKTCGLAALCAAHRSCGCLRARSQALSSQKVCAVRVSIGRRRPSCLLSAANTLIPSGTVPKK